MWVRCNLDLSLIPYLNITLLIRFILFFFNDTATTEIYTLSLHDALPIDDDELDAAHPRREDQRRGELHRSEEHTSELQSRPHLVCRLLLEKKKTRRTRSEKETETKTKKHPISLPKI